MPWQHWLIVIVFLIRLVYICPESGFKEARKNAIEASHNEAIGQRTFWLVFVFVMLLWGN